MRRRILDVTMTDQDYEALKKKLLETYSVHPTLLNPTVKRWVDWHCLVNPCFMDAQVFDKRENWLRHHQRFHNRNCGSDKGYPKEIEARRFIQEHARRWNAGNGIAGAGGSAGLMPPTATPAGPHVPISGALCVVPLNSAAPSSSISGALCGAPRNHAAPNPPRSGALRNSAAAPSGGPYRPRANTAACRQEHPDLGFLNIDGALQDEHESSGTLDADQREILMQQLSYNLQAVSQINTDSVRIMEILGMPSTNCVSEIRRPVGSKRPRESPNTGAQEYPATTVATPVPLPTWVDSRALASTSRRATGPQADQSKFAHAASTSQAPAHSNEGPAYPSQTLELTNIGGDQSKFAHAASTSQAPAYPSQALELTIGVPGHSYESPPLSIERPAHPYEAPALSIDGSAFLALTYMTPSQPEEKEEEENYNAASDSDRVGSDNEYQAAGVSHDIDEGQVECKFCWQCNEKTP